MQELHELDRIYYDELVPQEELLQEALQKLIEDETNLEQAMMAERRKETFQSKKATAEQAAEERLRQALLMNDDDSSALEGKEEEEALSDTSAFARLQSSLLTTETDKGDIESLSSLDDEDENELEPL